MDTMRLISKLQDRAATLFGLDPERRTPLVRSMLHRPRGDSAGYWLQLVIAVALATLGLALDSAAVVIGAILIAPLMRPIVELAMGLARTTRVDPLDGIARDFLELESARNRNVHVAISDRWQIAPQIHPCGGDAIYAPR